MKRTIDDLNKFVKPLADVKPPEPVDESAAREALIRSARRIYQRSKKQSTAYFRDWRQKNPDKVRQNTENFYLRKAQEFIENGLLDENGNELRTNKAEEGGDV